MPKKRKTKYQGREITATIQAPTKDQLEMMLRELGDYTMEVGLEPIKILSRGKDPDGGYRAIIVAHNFNPIEWLKGKWEERKGGPEERARLKEIEKMIKLQKRRAKLVAAGAAAVRAEATKAARKEYARRGITLKKLKVETEIPVYGARAAKAGEIPVEFEKVKAPKAAKPEVVYALTESGKKQAESSDDEIFAVLIEGPATASKLATALGQTPETVRGYLKSMLEAKLVRIRPSAAKVAAGLTADMGLKIF